MLTMKRGTNCLLVFKDATQVSTFSKVTGDGLFLNL